MSANPGHIFVVPTPGYQTQHDPCLGRRDCIQVAGEWVPESSWYMRRLAEGVIAIATPPPTPVVYSAPPVTTLDAPTPKPAKRTKKDNK